MGLHIPYSSIEEFSNKKVNANGMKVGAPAIIAKPTVSTIDPFKLRKIDPREFGKKELDILWQRFFMELDTFIIYFLEDAIKEKYGYPEHLRKIGKQLIAYDRYNLIVAPRGFSKSTLISAGFPIREIMYRMKEYIIIVSETVDIASDFTETIRFELENNEKLKLFYGTFKSKKEEGDSTEKWTVADIICKSQHPRTRRPFYTRIRARGSGQQIRGKKMRHSRPDLLIFDDMESRSNTETKEQRAKITKWFNRDALKIMDRYDSESGKGQVIVAGTIVHPESRLNLLKKNTEDDLAAGRNPVWKMQFYKAAENIETLENPLWPERFSVSELQEEKRTAIANGDYAGFLQEFFNEPIVEEDKSFKDIYFSKRYNSLNIKSYYGKSVLEYENQIYPCHLSAGLDLGGWEDKGSDFTGIVIGASIYNHIKREHAGFVLEAYNERLDPSEVIDLMFDISKRFTTYDEYGNIIGRIPWTVETNAFQTLLYHFLNKEMLARNDFSINIAHEDHESKNKRGRILSLVPVFKSGYYTFGNHLDWLIKRFTEYGTAPGMHDDIEDAFEKMHRNLARLNENSINYINKIMPYQHVVEPAKKASGNWYTL